MEKILKTKKFHLKIKDIKVRKEKDSHIFTLKVEFKFLNKKSEEHLIFDEVLTLETEFDSYYDLSYIDLIKVKNFDFLFSFEDKLLDLIEENLHGDFLEKIKSDIF